MVAKKTPLQPLGYDAINKVFRTYVNPSAALLNVTITQIRPSASSNPYGVIQSQQYSSFDYGFTPAIGDSINVSVKCKGQVYVSVAYYGEELLVKTQPATAGIATVSYGYVVKY